MATETFSEKVSVNINSSTLSSIDLLVDHSYYSNRSDFINQALRTALQQHQSTIDRIVDRNLPKESKADPWFLGVYGITPQELAAHFENQERFSIRGYGVLLIDSECPEEQVYEVIQEIRVKGKVVCTPSIKAHYGLK